MRRCSLLILALCSLGGCGGTERADILPALTKAKERFATESEAAKEAEASKYATELYEQAKDRLSQAEAWEEQGELEKAAKQYRRAASCFRSASEQARKDRSRLEAANGQRARYQELRKTAENMGVPVLDPAGWEQADREFKEGSALLEDTHNGPRSSL